MHAGMPAVLSRRIASTTSLVASGRPEGGLSPGKGSAAALPGAIFVSFVLLYNKVETNVFMTMPEIWQSVWGTVPWSFEIGLDCGCTFGAFVGSTGSMDAYYDGAHFAQRNK